MFEEEFHLYREKVFYVYTPHYNFYQTTFRVYANLSLGSLKKIVFKLSMKRVDCSIVSSCIFFHFSTHFGKTFFFCKPKVVQNITIDLSVIRVL